MPDVGIAPPILKALPAGPPVTPIARIKLHGRLRRKFGPEFQVGASSVARAIRIISILRPDFREELEIGEYKVVRGPLKGGVQLDERGLGLRLPPNGEMHLVPVAKGAKQTGPGKIILGAVLVVAAFALPLADAALFGATATAETAGTAGFVAGGGSLITAGTVLGTPVLSGLALFGGSMILGGISAILTANARQPTASASSFLLGGQTNVTTQGGVVPVVYGRTMAGSVAVSFGYDTHEFALPSATIEQMQADGLISMDIIIDHGFVSNDGTFGYSGDLPLPPGVVEQTGAGSGDPFGTGAGGGAKGRGGGAEDPNTLRSNATVRIIDVISEGPVGGLVGGPEGIFFNGTPLRANDGTFNFHGVSWEFRTGLPDQPPVTGFPAAEQIVSVNIAVIHGNPVTQTFHSDTATAVKVTINITAMIDVDEHNGDQRMTWLSYSIEVRPSKEADSGGWVGSFSMPVNNILHGKCTSPYEITHRFDLPGRDQGANVWDIRVTRTIANSTRATLQNDFSFELYTIVTDHKMMYPNSAYCALTVDARSFAAGAIPQRNYLVDGRQVMIPYNYDPVNRTYATSGPGTVGGTWDAVSFKPAVPTTSNPAWILYDMMSHERYGSGTSLTALEVTRADLYVIAQYCDGLVPDGFGTVEPRYQVNAVIADRVEAYTMFQTMVSAFRGMTYWGAGQVQIVADMPKNPVKLVNQANVIDGNFTYQGTSLKTRHNMARVTWRNPDNYYRQEVEVFEMTDDINMRGMVPVDIIAFGVTSRSLARRLGKWMLYTENQQTEALQYDASLYNLSLRPGDVFQQQDPNYVGLRWAGRLRSLSTQTILHLDGILDFATGNLFTMTVVMPDDTVAQVQFSTGNVGTSADGTYSIVFLPPGVFLPQQPLPQAEWIVIDNIIDPRLFQAVTVSQTATGRYQVAAVQHNPQKFDEIELGITFKPQIFSVLPNLLLAGLTPPTNVSARDYLVGVGNTTVLRVTVSWTMAQDQRIDHYEVQAASQSFLETYQAKNVSSYDIDGLTPDTYTFSVRSVSITGQTSVWVSTDQVVVDGLADPPPQIVGLQVIGGTRRFMLTWQGSTRRDIKYYEVQRAPAIGADPGVPFAGHINPGAPGSFTYVAYVGATSWIDGQSDLLIPNSIWYYRVRAITTTDVPGPFSDPQWGLTTMLVADDLADGILNTAKFAQTIKPVTLVEDITTNPPGLEGDITFDEKTNQLYKMVNGHWQLLIDLGTITGILDDAKIAALAASKLTGQLTSDQILSLAVAKISGQIQASQIAAGAVTTEKLSVGSASNLMVNCCCEQTADGWNFGATSPITIAASGSTKGTSLDPTWRLVGFGNGFMTTNAIIATNSSQQFVAAYDPNYTDAGNPLGVAFPPNTAIEAQARLMLHRCVAYVRIDFYTAGAVYISSIVGSRAHQATPPDGKSLDRYVSSWAHGTSPGNAARARFVVVAYNDGGTDFSPQGTTPPYCFFTECAIGLSTPNATEPAPWTPGGVTSITGPMIKTGTIQTQQLAAGSINADRLAARSITASLIQSLSITANELAANSVTLGKVAAGAINSDQIAVNQIHATHLAADFQLTQSAQFGTAVIGTAQIQNLAVANSNIANSAVTNVAAGAAGSGSSRLDVTATTNGSPIIILQSAQMATMYDGNTGGAVVGWWNVYRDGQLMFNGNAATPIPSWIDSPGAGNHTYTILSFEGFGGTNSGLQTSLLYLIALTIKK